MKALIVPFNRLSAAPVSHGTSFAGVNEAPLSLAPSWRY